jgi:hypothetical protein
VNETVSPHHGISTRAPLGVFRGEQASCSQPVVLTDNSWAVNGTRLETMAMMSQRLLLVVGTRPLFYGVKQGTEQMLGFEFVHLVLYNEVMCPRHPSPQDSDRVLPPAAPVCAVGIS